LATGTVFEIFLAIAIFAIATMVFLGNYKSRDPLPQAAVTAPGYVIRRYWFGLTLVVAVAAFAITIPFFPYNGALAGHGARHYVIVARQYSFTLPISVPVRTPVIFDVTATDVNHGFGIYTPDGQVFAQVQAMPDYVNHLELVFLVPGHYTVRCLEYCGIAHAAMHGEFNVR
jgi:cytochrome c oxidase subunit 2